MVYQRMIDAALRAVGAPPGLVQIVTGYGEAGNALVTGGVDKLIFVGSTAIGHKVGRGACCCCVGSCARVCAAWGPCMAGWRWRQGGVFVWWSVAPAAECVGRCRGPVLRKQDMRRVANFPPAAPTPRSWRRPRRR